MHPFELTRRLIEIESISGNELAIGEFLAARLEDSGWEVRRIAVENRRFNVYACVPGSTPAVVFSTHMDTVPPYISFSEDEEKIYGRGACDTKGIIAAMITAAGRLREEGVPVGLLFVVGEERDSLGARVANDHAPGSRFLINGEPTENKVATASKGALRVEVIARGKMAHSAYPELGDSAIDKLLNALESVRKLKLPENPDAGPTTMNIGVIEGGRAPNVISDMAKAQLLYRLVGPADELKKRIMAAAGPRVQVEFVLEIPYVKLRTFPGLPTTTAAFTTDIPALSRWGEPVLFGPGSIHVAHTSGEYMEKRQLLEAIEIYCDMARTLARDEGR